MSEYSLRDVQRTLGLSRGMILNLVASGYVAPRVGPRRAYRFTFNDLVVMRTAQELLAAKVPARRVSKTLKSLRERLPGAAHFGGLRIRAAGDRIVVQDGVGQWDAGSGQYLLDLSTPPEVAEVRTLLPARPAGGSGEEWFARGCELEDAANPDAADAYRRAIDADPLLADAYLNLGRLLQEQRRSREAEEAYRSGIERCPSSALLRYNLGVLLDETGRQPEALNAYRDALTLRPDFADCHYNIALLYQATGQTRAALRHLNAYRKLPAS